MLEDMEKGKKRDRSVNFSREDTDLLVSLIEKRKNVIENKKSDAVTWQEKEAAWTAIGKEFNSSCSGVFRDAKHLKIKYEAMKRDTRKKSALVRAERYKTGDGPTTASPLTSTEKKLKDMILISVEELDSVFDSDQSVEVTDYEDNVAITNQELQGTGSNNMYIQEEEPEPPLEEWSQLRPSLLKTKKHPALSHSKDKRPFAKLTAAKLEVALLQKKILEEEYAHKQKINELEIKQNLLKIKLLEKELQIKEKTAQSNGVKL